MNFSKFYLLFIYLFIYLSIYLSIHKIVCLFQKLCMIDMYTSANFNSQVRIAVITVGNMY